MSERPFRIEALGTQDRSGFICGTEALNRYFQAQVTQDIRRQIAACYIAIDAASECIAGYYTLSAADIRLTDIPQELVHKLPRYPTVPMARIGRLAVDTRYQGRKLGAALLLNAATRSARSEIAVFGMIVDVLNEQSENFCRYYGIQAYGFTPKQLMIPLTRIKQLISALAGAK